MNHYPSLIAAIAAFCLLSAGCESAATPGPDALFPDCPQPKVEPRRGGTVRLMVPMRDCVRLATNIILPDSEGPNPVIVVRTPYGRANSDFLPLPGVGNALFAPHGYAVVEQDTRGRFESEGDFVPYLVERADTEDTLDWIVRQPWYNGKLGVWGLSYLGLTAELAMVVRPDLVQAAFIGEIRSDFYAGAFENGIARADTLGLWLLGVLERHELSFSTEAEQATAMLEFPLLDGDERVVGRNIDFIDDFAAHLFEDEFWTADLNPELLAQTDIPVFMFEGWFDFFAAGMLQDWDNITARRNGKDQYIVVGPWTHMMGFSAKSYPFPNGGSIVNYVKDMVDFFDRYLKGEDTFGVARARYYDGGLGQWRVGDSLWPQATESWRLYADLSVTQPTCDGRSGSLAASPPTVTSSYIYDYDPYDPVILNAANILDLYGRDGMQPENDWCSRSDAIVFDSAALTAPVEIGGDIAVHLNVSTDAPDTSFFVRLSLVDTDGIAYNLREGAMLLSHREGNAAPARYEPGSTVALAIPLPPLRWTLQPGQKLRLVVTSSGFPFIAAYPNTGEGWPTATAAITAQQTILTGSGAQPTALEITIAK